jgi:NAD(P)-dependent dehydrogenase (short-subunit alcohol dehydrogenase family)
MKTLDLFRLDGKVALVSGGAGIVGRHLARGLSEAGAKVIVASRNPDSSVLDAEAEQCDFTSESAIVALRQRILDRHGRVDVLFNNAAAPRFAPIAELSDEDWHFTMRNELDLIFFVTQASWPHLIDAGGVIINTASVQGLVGIVMNGGLAHRANSISPGTIATQATARLVADEQLLNSILAPLLIKRLGEPVDVAALAVYLPPTSRPTSRARTSWSTEG